MSDAPKILLLDIETFPNISFTWGKYDQNVIEFLQEYCIATFSAKWYNGGKVFAKALPDYPGYSPKSYDDKAIVQDLWNLLDEADIVIAHNGNDFDIRMIQGRFIFHKMTPPSPFKKIDTKQEFRKVARFNSNSLNDLGKLLGEGKKIKTDFDLWSGCINGDPKSWQKMVHYNKKDVLLLERVYKRLLPWVSTHPDWGLYLDEAVCPKCGNRDIEFRGYTTTLRRKYRRFMCKKCGGWGRVAKSEPCHQPYQNIVS